MEKQNAKRTAAVAAAALGGAGSVIGAEHIVEKISDEQNDYLQDENICTADVTDSGLSESAANDLEEMPIAVEPEMIVTEPYKQEEQIDTIDIVEPIVSVNSIDSEHIIDNTDPTNLIDPPINPEEHLDPVDPNDSIGLYIEEMYGGPGGPLDEYPDTLIGSDGLNDELSDDILSSESGFNE